MNASSSNNPYGQQASSMADNAADSANSALRSAQNKTNAVLDRMSEKVDEFRDQAAPMINRLSEQASTAAKRSVEAVRDTSVQVKEQALRASDATVGYIKDEPVRAMLIAAATGAVLMALLSMMNRSRD